MGCVFISKVLMSRGPHCAPSKAAWWAHQKYQGDTPFTHTWEKNPRLCTQLPVPAKVLYKYCVQQSKLHRLRENHRNIQETQSLFPFWGASCIVMICKADGMLPLWCPGVSWHLQAQPETPGGGCKWATCLETVLHWCSCGQRHLGYMMVPFNVDVNSLKNIPGS